ncbi:Oidioi.mRNA.OKI2018_I69.chr2.g4429.t1.cds [Oikopleura dioica]|uniref:Oidioi.mRNA.OKI2018_I69.chr2.g4429.t1.cds n=1 Tax=Oikopleura dioica TaxID=34765 RepID=A0ABN7SXA6_OIKDI|nr:Oidioi.mRNA.OKI2018_I69.chr2.g4429.t1.cds [Oikopleura dioica]
MNILKLLAVFFVVANAKRKKRGRVKGGSKVTSDTKYPSFVSIVTQNGGHFCGSVILDATTVLSSSHCDIETSNFVVFGTLKRSNDRNFNPNQNNVARIKSVKNFGKIMNSGLWKDDYTLVTLSSPIRFNSKVKAAKLGTFDEFANNIMTGKTTCMIVGNGQTDMSGSYSDTLKEGRTKIHSYQLKAVGFMYGDKENVFLMDNSGKAIAGKGDSGGPLYCPINGVQKVFGVASFAHNGEASFFDAYTGYAAVFTPIAHQYLRRWNPANKTPRNFEDMDIMVRNYVAHKTILTSSSTAAKTGEIKVKRQRYDQASRERARQRTIEFNKRFPPKRRYGTQATFKRPTYKQNFGTQKKPTFSQPKKSTSYSWKSSTNTQQNKYSGNNYKSQNSYKRYQPPAQKKPTYNSQSRRTQREQPGITCSCD